VYPKLSNVKNNELDLYTDANISATDGKLGNFVPSVWGNAWISFEWYLTADYFAPPFVLPGQTN